MSDAKLSDAELAKLAKDLNDERSARGRLKSRRIELARRIYVELVRTDAYKLGTDGYEAGSLTEMAEAALDAAEVFEACAANRGSER